MSTPQTLGLSINSNSPGMVLTELNKEIKSSGITWQDYDIAERNIKTVYRDIQHRAAPRWTKKISELLRVLAIELPAIMSLLYPGGSFNPLRWYQLPRMIKIIRAAWSLIAGTIRALR